MPTTSFKGYEIQSTGSNAGTWGTVLNDQMISYVDVNLGGSEVLALASTTPITLTATQSRKGLLVFSGTLTANIAITTLALGVFWVENRTTGNFYVSLTNGVGTPMLVPQGSGRQVWSDATYGVRALGLPPPGSFLDLGAATPHPSLLATTALVGEYLLCDGTSFLTTGVTASLYEAIGTTWGAGPLLPDLRNRARFGKWTAGSGGTQRITTAGIGIAGETVGAVGGAQNAQLTAAMLPASIPNSAVTPLTNGGSQVTSGAALVGVASGSTAVAPPSGQGAIVTITAATTVTINAASGGTATTPTTPPAAICNVLIKI